MSDEGREAPAGGGRRLLNATAVMASGTMVSRVLGFGRAVLLAFVLGNGTRQAEMFNLATLIPNTLYMLFAGGALNTVLVPQIVRAIKNDRDGGQIFVNRIITAFLVALAVVTALMVVAVPWLLTLWTAPQWQTLPHWQSLVLITYLTMPQLFFYGAFFLIGQVLNARDVFGPMMWAPLVNNVVQIGVLGMYAVAWGHGVSTSEPFTVQQALLLGGGSTVGILAQTMVLIPFYRRTGFGYRPRWDLKGTGLGHTFHLAKWMMGYVALTLIAQVVVTRLATSAVVGGSGAGSNTYNQAYLIWVLPHSLLTVSLATAMLPQASRLAAVKDLVGVADEVNRAIRLAVTFLVPAAVGLIVLADPIARVAFGSGQGRTDYHFVAWTLMAFAIGLVPYTIQYLYLRGFYALEDTKTPFYLQVAISGANTVLAIGFVLAWQNVTTVAPRLALAYSLAYLLGVWISHRALRRRLPALSGRSLVRHLAALVAATIPAAILAYAITWLFSRFSGVAMALVGLGLAGVVAMLTFFFAAKRLGIAETTHLLAVLRRRRTEAEPEPVAVVENEIDELADEVGHGPPEYPGDVPADTVNDDPDGTGQFITVPPPEASPADQPLLHYPDPEDGHAPAMDMPTDAAVANVVVGQVLGERYRLDEVLARRGNALTWRAFDQRLSRPVLMHLLPPDDPRGPELIGVAKRASGAPDSAFLRVLDAGAFDEGESYIVYEYSTGTSIEEVLRGGALSPVEAAWVVKELAQAMAALHSRGLFHERLNPETVVITAAGNVRIVGLLVEAALDPAPQPFQGETADVRALGALLYACLVTRWPGADAYGMKAAPADGARTLSPAQVKAGVPRMLDTLCDRILNRTPRNRQSPITTARAIAQQLNAVLGQASAAPDLERRLRMPIEPIRTTAGRTARGAAATSALGAAATFSAPLPPPLPHPAASTPDDYDTGESTQPWQLPGLDEPQSSAEPFTPIPPPARAPDAQLMVPSPRRGGIGRPRRTALAVVIGLFGLMLAGGLVWVAVVQLNMPRAVPAPTVSASATQVIPIASVADFDPSADGGSNAENPRLVSRAIDDDPETFWLTERYRGDPRMGRMKPGVGLVVDLGGVKSVSQVSVAVLGAGTAVELRSPKNADVTSAPMRSQADWTIVDSIPKATGTAVFKLSKPIKTRFLLIYLTSLPPESGSFYQGGIGNIEVRG